MLYLNRTLECTSSEQRKYGTYTERRIERAMRVQAVVPDGDPVIDLCETISRTRDIYAHPKIASCQSTTVVTRIALGTVYGGRR
jgi:hypothetical protein